MKKVILISKLMAGILAIVNGLFAIVSNVGDVFPDLPDWTNIVYIVVCVVLGLFLVIGSVFDYITERRQSVHQYKLQDQSEKFFQFFTKWYSRPGKLSIICDDLDWIKNDKYPLAYNSLLDKSANEQLTLLLGKGINSKVVKTLKEKGAEVLPAPHNIVDAYTFSCLSVMDEPAGQIIVRDKHRHPLPGDGKVIIEEISNTYITKLLKAMLDERGYDQCVESNQKQ